MTLLSIFCPKFIFREAISPSVGGPVTTHWFLDAADQLATMFSSGTAVKDHTGTAEQSASDRLLGKPAAECECAKCKEAKVAKAPKVAKSPKIKRSHMGKIHNNKYKTKHTSIHGEEADSSSQFPAHTREALKFIATNIREAAGKSASAPSNFRVVLIQEGLGNFNDAFYYSRDAIESGIEIFNGLKVYADHPTSMEEEIRPERSTRDIIGHYENLSVEESDGGCAILCADLVTVPGVDIDWARALMSHAVENAEKFPDRPFVGLSINASGDSAQTDIGKVMQSAPEGAQAKLEEAQANGIESVKVVNKINAAKSCDLVTEAGAGGKIIKLIEGDEANGKESKKSQRKSG